MRGWVTDWDSLKGRRKGSFNCVTWCACIPQPNPTCVEEKELQTVWKQNLISQPFELGVAPSHRNFSQLNELSIWEQDTNIVSYHPYKLWSVYNLKTGMLLMIVNYTLKTGMLIYVPWKQACWYMYLENRHVGFHLHSEVRKPCPALSVGHRVVHTDLQVVCWEVKLNILK